MAIATCFLEGISPYSQSAPIRSEKGANERHDEFEKRTWMERLNTDASGHVVIPAMAFKNALTSAARYLSEKVPGKRNATYSKHFTSGIVMTSNVVLDIKKDDIDGEWLFVPSDGKRGGGSRVWKCFPLIREWKASVEIHVIDEMITKEVFERHMRQAGSLIGIGRFRPQCNGFYGRFEVKSVKWS